MSIEAVDLQPPLDFPPAWASGYGENDFGVYSELDFGRTVIRLRWIPPGEFPMGSPEDESGRDSDEILHQVKLTRGFWIADTPCTQAQWTLVNSKNPSENKDSELLPVESVTWEESVQFCEGLNRQLKEKSLADQSFGFRLPSEAEWEYACRAGTVSAFNDGSACKDPQGKDPALDGLAWFDGNSDQKTHPVKAKKPNAWGLYDMHGNVWEWCLDKCDWEGEVVTDTYKESIVDPLCEKGARRVVRGGSAWNRAGSCRSAVWSGDDPAARLVLRGFRLVAGHLLL